MSDENSDLSQQAEEVLQKRCDQLNNVPPADMQRMIHELQVHRLELEMQNEELRLMQHELEASREKYFNLYDLAPVGYVTLNEKGIILEANLFTAELVGTDRSHLVGQPLYNLVYIEDQDLYYLCYKQLVSTRGNQVCEVRIAAKNDPPRWVRVDIGIMQGTGDVTIFRAVMTDITERKQSEEQLRLMIEHAPAALAVLDYKMCYLNVSRRWLSDYNLGVRELRGLSHYEVFPEIPERWKAIHRRALAGEILRSDNDWFDRADGSVQWLRWEVGPWYDVAGNVGGIVIFRDDITERKQMESALLAKTRLLNNVINSSQDYIFVKDFQLRTVMCNEIFAKALGKSPSDLYGKTDIENGWDAELVKGNPEKGIRGFEQDDLEVLSGKIVHSSTDLGNVNGTTVCFDSIKVPLKDNGGEIFGLLGISRDITKQKQIENALIESHYMINSAARIAHLGTWKWNFSDNSNAWSEEQFRILGVPREVQPSSDIFFKAVIPQDHDKMKEAIELARACVRPYEVECRVVWPSGELRHVYCQGEIQRDETGRQIGMIGTSLDITERKLSEEALCASEERYRRLFEVESDAIFLVDCETDQFIEVNAAALALYGYNNEEFLALSSGDVSAEPNKTRRAIAEEQTNIPLRFHRKKDGNVFPVEITGSYFEYQGRKLHVAAIRDISDRVKAEIELRESEERLNLALAASRMGVWEWDFNTGSVLCSPECLAILGLESFGGSVESFIKAMHPEDVDRVMTTANQAVANRADYKSEFRIIRPNGEVRWVYHLGRAKYGENGTPLRLVGTGQDITERKLAEASIFESEKKYRELVESLYEGVWAIDSADRTIFVNSCMAKMLGFTVEEMIGKGIISFIDSLGRDTADIYIHSRRPEVRERRRFDFRRKDGTILHTSVSVSARTANNDSYTGAIVCVVDITERLQLEQRIQQISNSERHRIGRDLHDDLGQRLTGIAFLSKSLAQKLAQKSLAEASDANTLLTFVNEAILKTNILARGLCPMDTGAENFVSGLTMLASKTEMIYGISCNCSVESTIRIHDNNQAVQLYYISKEAIHNAIKHGMAKNIKISLTSREGLISLTIRDDGVGFQKKLSSNEGLGLDTMSYRAGMMNAWLSINGDSSRGTVVKCTFKETMEGAG
jgi:PAS domain S-box-containing protein